MIIPLLAKKINPQFSKLEVDFSKIHFLFTDILPEC